MHAEPEAPDAAEPAGEQRWTSDGRLRAPEREQKAWPGQPRDGEGQLLHVDEAFSMRCVVVVVLDRRIGLQGDDGEERGCVLVVDGKRLGEGAWVREGSASGLS